MRVGKNDQERVVDRYVAGQKNDDSNKRGTTIHRRYAAVVALYGYVAMRNVIQ